MNTDRSSLLGACFFALLISVCLPCIGANTNDNLKQKTAPFVLAGSNDYAVNDLVLRAVALMARGDFTTAEPLLAKASEIDPGCESVQYNFCCDLLMLGKSKEALTHSLKAIELNKGSANNWYTLSLAYDAEGDFDSALDFCKKALQLQPNLQLAQWHYCMLLARTGHYKEARSLLLTFLERDPTNSTAWTNLGDNYLHTGELTAAADAYQHYIKLNHNKHTELMADTTAILQRIQQLMTDKTSHRPDYLPAPGDTDWCRWSAIRMPLRIYTENGTNVPYFQAQYQTLLRKAVTDWADASNGRIAVVFTNDRESADITTKWTADHTTVVDRIEDGQATISRHGADITGADITLFTCRRRLPAGMLPTGLKVTDQFIERTALHEIGHALGLIRHSDQSTDIMYAFAPAYDTTEKQELSGRDIRSLRTLYSN